MDLKTLAGVVITSVVFGSACSFWSTPSPDSFGSCKIEVGAVCRDQDLRNTSAVAANLRNADFTGSDLEGADLTNADLRGATLVGSNLVLVNFTGANLAGADLTGARINITNFTGANLDRVKMPVAEKQCSMIDTTGRFVEGEGCKDQFTPGTTVAPSTEPTTITSFLASDPVVCIDDLGGIGIDVQWKTKNALGSSFFMDGLRVGGSDQQSGRARLPFVCDGKSHKVELRAFGAQTALVAKSFVLSLTSQQTGR